jgi:hypothetical protein
MSDVELENVPSGLDRMSAGVRQAMEGVAWPDAEVLRRRTGRRRARQMTVRVGLVLAVVVAVAAAAFVPGPLRPKPLASPAPTAVGPRIVTQNRVPLTYDNLITPGRTAPTSVSYGHGSLWLTFAAGTSSQSGGGLATPGEVVEIDLRTMRASAAWSVPGSSPVAVMANDNAVWVAVASGSPATAAQPTTAILYEYTLARREMGQLDFDREFNVFAMDPTGRVWYDASGNQIPISIAGTVLPPFPTFASPPAGAAIEVSLVGEVQSRSERMMSPCSDGTYAVTADAASLDPVVYKVSYRPIPGKSSMVPLPDGRGWASGPEHLAGSTTLPISGAQVSLWCAPGGGVFAVTDGPGSPPTIRTVFTPGPSDGGTTLTLPVGTHVVGSGDAGLWIRTPGASGAVALTTIDQNLQPHGSLTVMPMAGAAADGNTLWTVSTDPHGGGDWIITSVAAS